MRKVKNKKFPTNRKELFFDIYRNRSSLIFFLGLICFLIFIPTVCVLLLTNLKIYEINLLYQNNEIEKLAAMQQTLYYIDARNLLFIITISFASIFYCGILNVLRKLIWQDGIIFGDDFKKGIKQNYKDILIWFFLLAIIYFVTEHSLRYLYFNTSFLSITACIASIIVLTILVIITPVMINQTIIYNLSFFKKLKNAFLISIRMIYLFLPLAIINVGVLLIIFIKGTVTSLIAIIILLVAILPALSIINMLICDYAFDIFINYDHFKEIYRKGLYDDAPNNN